MRELVKGIKEIIINETAGKDLPFFRNYSEVVASEIKGNVAFIDTRSGTIFTAKKEHDGFVVAHIASNGIVKDSYYRDQDIQNKLDEERWEILYSLSQPSENEQYFKQQSIICENENKKLTEENKLLRELALKSGK